MSMAKKMAERTSGVQADPNRRPASVADSSPATSTGRLLDVQIRVNNALDRADVAEERAAAAEAARAALEESLAEARKQLEALEASPSAAAEDVLISTLVEVEGRRRILTPDEYAELRANLAANPLMYPIVYMPLEDGRNELIAGHNRVSIYRDDLGRDRIKGVPFKGTRMEAELGSVFSNLLAPSLPDFEKYRQFVRMQDLSGLAQTDIIRLSGLTQGHVARIFSFANLPEEVKKLIAQKPHRLGGHAAQKLAMLSEQGHAAGVIEAVKQLVENDKLTQENAVTLASPKPKSVTTQPAQTFNRGKRKVCEMSVRNGVIGLRFNGKDAQNAAAEWSEKIAEFLRTNLTSEE